MDLISTLKYMLKPVVEDDIHLQNACMHLLRKIPLLLPHDPDYHGFRHLANGTEPGVFLDVGANVGLSALSFRSFNRKTPIFSLEPNPAHEKSLSQIKQSDPNFSYKMAAVGDAPGLLRLYVPFVGALALHTMASLSKAHAEEGCSLFLAEKYKPRLVIKEFEVEIITVDSLALNPAIMKIDCEGSELAALRGSRKTIEQSRPFIMMDELHKPDHFETLSNVLIELEYQIMFYSHKHDVFTRTRSKTRNAFFMPKEKLADLPVF